MTTRTAVVLCSLGGPMSLETVEPFLFNLFSDPDIFKFPLGGVTQRLFAYLIAKRRTPEASRGYAAIGGRSPLLENTQKQARALASALADSGYDIFVCMRYWHPLTEAVVAELKQKEYKQVILLPLYPQYSLTTTGSARNEFARQCKRQGYAPQVSVVERWHDDEDFLSGVVETIRAEATHFSEPDPTRITLLFSAHGLPQKVVDAGDPYERQVRATFDALRARLGWPHVDLCYQSRVGPLKWLQPYTDEMIRAKAAQGVQQMLVYPIAFVSDHIETLFELGITYAELARGLGVREYRVVPALNDHPRLIAALRTAVLTANQRFA